MNKQSIIHILGMLSSLFTTLDVNRQADSLEGASSQPVPSSESTQNPVGVAGMLPAELVCGGCVKYPQKFFFKFLQVVVVLQQVFPLIQRLLSRWLDDSEVVEV